jgi:hypothetical protein
VSEVYSKLRWVVLGNNCGVFLSDTNKRMAMETHKQLDIPSKHRRSELHPVNSA